MSMEISASHAVAQQATQVQQSAGQAGLKVTLEKDQEMVAMLQKAQADLQAVTPTRGSRVNVSV